MAIQRLEVTTAKAEYLLSNIAAPGEGGDKRKFWREILGFNSPETICEMILAQVAPDSLKETRASPHC
jgi:hypothetical protein